MILYHGSIVAVEKPQIIARSNGRGADFGVGFYCTSSYEQALKWTRIKMRDIDSGVVGFISSYEVQDDLLKLSDLSVLAFDGATPEWLQFVLSNRTNPNFVHNHDVVFGPVANDRVYATLTLFEGGFLDEEATIKTLKTYQLADQYLFHTEKSLSLLKFIKAEEVK